MDLDLGYQIQTIKPNDASRVIQKCRTALDNSLQDTKKWRDKILNSSKPEQVAEDIIHDLCYYAVHKAKVKFYSECIKILNDVQSQATQGIDDIQNSVVNFSKLVELSKVMYNEDQKYKKETGGKSKKNKRGAKSKSKKKKVKEPNDSLDFDIE